MSPVSKPDSGKTPIACWEYGQRQYAVHTRAGQPGKANRALLRGAWSAMQQQVLHPDLGSPDFDPFALLFDPTLIDIVERGKIV